LTIRIDSHGLVGDGRTVALISADGDLDWLCWPEFDSEACFAALLGSLFNGHWSLTPQRYSVHTQRYLPGTLVLETKHTDASGAVSTVTDFMLARDGSSCVVRIVRGISGHTPMRTCFAPRFDYGTAQPRLNRKSDRFWDAVTGPHRLLLHSDVDLKPEKGDLRADWTLAEGESSHFVLQHCVSYEQAQPPNIDPEQALRTIVDDWQKWVSHSNYHGQYREAVERSLLTLKALTYQPSGGFVAAPTTSLPEKVGGIRNWDYRFCWLRDTTFSLLGLLHCGYEHEARAWLNWFSRSVQGKPSDLKILYGVTGKREHSEWEAKWLSGYQGSSPVLIGNKASEQLQLGVYGEVLDALFRARVYNLYPLEDTSGLSLEVPLLQHLETIWDKPDSGLWEFRSEKKQYVESKAMAWTAFDRGVRMVERFGMKGPVERWRHCREVIHAQVCREGFHERLGAFTQAYGVEHMDAGVLLLPLIGFLPAADACIISTVKAIEEHLMENGFVCRYDTHKVDDGLPPGEGAFLACNFWLVEVYVLQGRKKEARALFERLLALRNHVGLLSEEYDPTSGLVGNFPQAFSHVGLINAALTLELGGSTRLRDLNNNESHRSEEK
jgi:GH15 family glucan-1,4-alpha-glucosidase